MGESRVHGVIQAIVWVAAVVVPIHVIATSNDPGEQWAAFVLLMFVLILSYQLGRVPHPDRPEWKDRKPGFVRVMMKWEHEYREEMKDREDPIPFDEWLEENTSASVIERWSGRLGREESQ